MAITLVLDTNVLVAGLRSSSGASHSLLRQVGTGHFVLGLTTALVLEYESVCLRHLDRTHLSSDDLTALLDYFCQVGRCCPVWYRLRPSVRDPGDELVIEAAVATGSSWIVTHHVRDMEDGAALHGIEVIRPQDALNTSGGIPMKPIQVELAPELREELARLAAAMPGGESAWVAEAIREKLAAHAEHEAIAARARRGSRADYERVLAKMPPVEPSDGDQL